VNDEKGLPEEEKSPENGKRRSRSLLRKQKSKDKASPEKCATVHD
jgi:hypothetical protein